jgi:hypothetical protein
MLGKMTLEIRCWVDWGKKPVKSVRKLLWRSWKGLNQSTVREGNRLNHDRGEQVIKQR